MTLYIKLASLQPLFYVRLVAAPFFFVEYLLYKNYQSNSMWRWMQNQIYRYSYSTVLSLFNKRQYFSELNGGVEVSR